MASNDLGNFYTRSGARYSYYAETSMRIRSFLEWPRDKHQTVEDLAEAGFFYAGKEDCTRCFYCAGGLCNWLPGDIPFVEHARWFPQCRYLRSVKGDEFVDNVHVNFPRTYDSENAEGDVEVDTNSKNAPDLDDIVDRIIQKPCGEAMLVLGYPPELVRAAITSVLSQCDWDESGVTSERLTHMALQMQEITADSAQPDSSKSDGTKTHTVSYFEKAATEALADLSLAENSKPSEGSEDNATVDLLTENRRLKDQMTCKVCMDREVSIALLPCGHLVSCEECSSKITNCPLCRRTVAARVKTYL